MSLMAKLFGSGKKGEMSPNPQEAIQRLRELEEMLQKKSEFLEKKIDQEVAFAKKNGTKNKKAALQALKRKQRYAKQLQQIDGTLSTVEFQREALENTTTNTEVLKVMGDAAKALKSAHKNMNIDDVHSLMDDIAEQQGVASEISDAISNPVGFTQDVEDDDLLAELEELEKEALEDQLLDMSDLADQLPTVPIEEPAKPIAATAAKSKHTEDDEMKMLEAWAS